MTLSNHEFDDKIKGIVPFLANQSCAVIVSNLNHSQVPELQGLYSKSIVKHIAGQAIGLVGDITPETAYIADPENLIFLDEVEALTAEVAILKEQGIKTIIAIGHSGYIRDQSSATTVTTIIAVSSARITSNCQQKPGSSWSWMLNYPSQTRPLHFLGRMH